MHRRLGKRIHSKLQTYWQLDIGKPGDVVLVAGSGRSGTTWIGNVIAAATHSRTIFEPFLRDDQRRAVSAPRTSAHLIDRHPFLSRASESNAAFAQTVDRIFSGRQRTAWTEQAGKPGIYKRRIVKAIRANMMLGWLANRYKALPIIWIVRNPISVIHSQWLKIQAGWSFTWEPTYVLSQPELMERYLQPFSSCIEHANSLIEKLACKWCIETYVPSREILPCDHLLAVRYEDLKSNVSGQSTWQKIADHIPRVSWSNDLALTDLQRPSFTSKPGCTRTAQQRFSRNEVDTIKRVVELFELTDYLSTETLCLQ